MGQNLFNRLIKPDSNRRFWIILVMFLLGTIAHYPQEILNISEPSLFSFLGSERHTIERVLFLLPIIYSSFIFGFRGGLISLALAIGIMVPRAVLISPYPGDAYIEITIVFIIGILVIPWIETRRREQGRSEQALLRLEVIRQEFQSYVQVIESNEKMLSTINAVGLVISQSLELQDVLEVTTKKVSEVMNVDVALIFLLNDKTKELELRAYRGVSDEFAVGLKGLQVGEGFNGRVAQSGTPLLVENSSSDPRLTREVVRQERLFAQLIVPLTAKDKVVGTLCVAGREKRQFQNEDVETLNTIGRQVGIAIENSRLYQTQRLMVEKEKEMQDKLRYYVGQVTKAQEEERQRIAQELHDDTIQDLVLLLHQIDIFMSTNKHLSRRDTRLLEELRNQISKISAEVRRFTQDLRPSVLDDLGLMPALEWLVSDVSKYFGIEIEVSIIGEIKRFPPETELVLFRIVQEALRNVWKHSKATRTWITTEFTEDRTIITVKDNGAGFEMPEEIEDLTTTGKLGLLGMQERVQLVGGHIKLESEAGKGTTIVAEVPV